MLKSRCSTEEVVMKRIMIWSGVALLLVATGIFVVRARGSGRQGFGRAGWSHHGPLGYVAYELNLSMVSVTAQGNFDDGKVEAIAARQGATVVKRVVV
jgi:hypothetical protein